MENPVIGLVANMVEADDFSDPVYRRLFAHMQKRYRAGEPITAAGLVAHGFNSDTVADIYGSAATTVNAPFHANLIRSAARRRKLTKSLDQIQEETTSGSDLCSIADAMHAALIGLAESDTAMTRAIGNDISETMQQVEECYANEGRITGLQTGLGELDGKLGGIKPGQFIVVAARPSMGKSALATTIAADVAERQGGTVVFFSLEMSRTEIVQRLIASNACLDLARLSRGKLDVDEFKAAHDAASRVYGYGKERFIVNDAGTMTATGIRAEIEMLQQLGNVDLVVVDYLQLMQPGMQRTRNDEVAEITRALKVLARDLSVPVIALSQLNRQVEHRDSGKPRLADLRDSGAIEQDADVVIFIYRDDEGHNLNLAKNRNGPLWDLPVIFSKEHVTFYGVDNVHSEGAA
jgi:replicative DNA helicase